MYDTYKNFHTNYEKSLYTYKLFLILLVRQWLLYLMKNTLLTETMSSVFELNIVPL